MKPRISMAFLVLLIVVMLGVVFGILTNSRNSILVKEIFYVAGGSIASIMAAVFLLMGKPFYKGRIPSMTLASVGAILLLMIVMHYTGTGSPNGPFTFFMLLSLYALTVSSLLFISEVHVKLFISIMLGTVSIMFVYALMQWQGINVFAWDAALTRSGRSTGSLGNPNLLGGFASAVIPLGAAYLFSLKKFTIVLRTTLVLIFAALATATVVASGTRGSIIGVAAGAFVLVFWFIRKNSVTFKKAIPFVLLLVALVAAVTLPMINRLSELDPSLEDQGTLQVRKIIWLGAFDLFRDSPVLGHGPGSFQILFPEYRNPYYSILGVSHNTLHAHCEYLEILVDIGLVGLILWGLAVWGVLRRLKNVDLLRAGAMAGLAAMLAEGFVSVHLRWPPTAWLFATLLMVFLSRDTEPASKSSRSRIRAISLFLVSLILAAGLFIHYLPASRASALVFRGKDIFLARTEMTMNGAYSASAEWVNSGNESAFNAAITQWQNAKIYADSAVTYSREATEVYPYDLGGWYALGSALLTRYMVLDPPVPSMRSAIEAAGLSGQISEAEIRNDLLSGMAAYDSLITMAPNYAEVHNNLALGYSNLGMLDESMEELYRSYKIHAHRRIDYVNQVHSLLTIHPGSAHGAILCFHQSLMDFDQEATGEKLDKNVKTITENAWFLTAIQPENAAVLQEEFIALIEEILPVEFQESLIERTRTINEYSPFASWENGSLLSMNDHDALLEYRKMSAVCAWTGRVFPAALPAVRDFYTYPAEILFQSNWDPAIYDLVLDVFRDQIVIDRNLDDTNTLIASDRFAPVVEPSVAVSVRAVRFALGGSRTALRQGFVTPWLSGALPEIISDSLHQRMYEDSLNTDWYRMELKMTFLLVSSYWWDYNIFASGQNQYLLERIFYCRDMIRELEPVSWQSIVSSILTSEIERISLQTNGVCPATVGMLRDDLVNGAAREYN
ncbi:MAG: O-antigen ligase family protein [Candidatus Fermentibacteria bacterium]|nr:O-antigen ligase family protein [Candidatus Fermentibacteria bacterium]